MPDEEAVLSAAIVKLGNEYGRYGYRCFTELLRAEGWPVNAERAQQIWWREGLEVAPVPSDRFGPPPLGWCHARPATESMGEGTGLRVTERGGNLTY